MTIACAHAQNANNLIKIGNDAYKKGDYKNAVTQYQKALQQDAKNNIAKFNLGNALQKQNQFAESEKEYDEIAKNSTDENLQANSYYNKGVSLVQQKKLPEAITAFKQSLKLSPTDDSARENLQKALNDLKQQQQNQSQNNQQKKQQKQNQQKQKQQPQDKNPLSKQRAEQLLSNLRQQEKELQKKLQQQKTTTGQPEKDW
ncbi:MAG: tetratricopeptide repeat protein [Chitinophagaceae bacterium]